MKQQTFWQKNQVFIIGLAGAMALALQQFLTEPNVDWKVIGYAALIAIAGYISNEWRGKGVTVGGFIGTIAYTFYSIQSTGHFTVNQFILMLIVNFLSMVAPPPKPAGYEQSATITQAKAEGTSIQNRVEQTPPKQV